MTAFLALTGLLVAPPSWSTDLKDVHFPTQTIVDGRTLHLNGTGLRKKSVFHVDVYAAGLYLENPSKNEASIIKSDEIKKLVVIFLHNGTAKQVTDSWNEGFEKNCHDHCELLASRLQRMNALMTDVQSGQVVRLTFFPDHLIIASKGRVESFPGRDFADMVLATFIGKKPPTQDLKAGLLASSSS